MGATYDSATVVLGSKTFFFALTFAEEAQLISFEINLNGTLSVVERLDIDLDDFGQKAPELALSGDGQSLYLNGQTSTQSQEIDLNSNGSFGAIKFGIVPTLVGTEFQSATNTIIFETDTLSFSNGATIGLGISQSSNSIVSFSLNSNDTWQVEQELSADHGFWVSTPTAIETSFVDGTGFAIIASAGTSSITVVKVGSDGDLVITDHLVDSLDTRFANTTVIGKTEVHNRVFVAAAGSDDGISVFELLPNGKLLLLGVMADQVDTVLDNVSSLELVPNDTGFRVLVGSSTEVGVTVFETEVTANDLVLEGSAGGTEFHGSSGTDIFIDNNGPDTFYGGDGADIFVGTNDGMRNQFSGFVSGIDRIDLTGWKNLYSLSSLTYTQLNSGGLLGFGDNEVRIITENGTPLSREDLISTVSISGYRFLADVEENVEADPDTISGTSGADTLSGENGESLILGGNGDDNIFGGAGDDTLYGHNDDDSLFGGDGNDALFGGSDDDELVGGDGHDKLSGAAGLDILFGGRGTIRFRAMGMMMSFLAGTVTIISTAIGAMTSFTVEMAMICFTAVQTMTVSMAEMERIALLVDQILTFYLEGLTVITSSEA